MYRFLLVALLAFAPLAARAELVIDITQGTTEPMPVAINALVGSLEDEARVGRDIARVVSANLERSGLFRPLDPRSFLQDAADHALVGFCGTAEASVEPAEKPFLLMVVPCLYGLQQGCAQCRRE